MLRAFIASLKAREVWAGVGCAALLLGIFWVAAGRAYWAGLDRSIDPLVPMFLLMEPLMAIAILSGALIGYLTRPGAAHTAVRHCMWSATLSGMWIFTVFILAGSPPSRWVTRPLDIPILLVSLLILLLFGAIPGLIMGVIGSMGTAVLTPLRRRHPRAALLTLVVAHSLFIGWSVWVGARIGRPSKSALALAASLEPTINRGLVQIPADRQWHSSVVGFTRPMETKLWTKVPGGQLNVYPPLFESKLQVSLELRTQDKRRTLTCAEAVELLRKCGVRERLVQRVKPSMTPGDWLAEDGAFSANVSSYSD